MDFAPGAKKYGIPLIFIALFVWILSPPLSLAIIALAGFVFAFFRDPKRTPPSSGIISPADGKVSVIRKEDDRIRVGVFMNVTNVHVNRAPFDGSVESITHSPGKHKPAFSKESDRNEKVEIDFNDFKIILIAGAFARRIHPYIEVGEEINRGDKIGHISFGSRADILMPKNVSKDDLVVEKGSKVYAGQSKLTEGTKS